MAETPPQERPRTATRHRYVAAPGMSLPEESDGARTIGRYEILETLGKGAMGVVYKARDPALDRIVAVKTIVSPRGGGRRVRRAYLERFEREAKAAAKMQHPAIVTIFDVGEDNSMPFMVLEYLPGESLADRLDSVRMPLGKSVQIALDLASALGYAHDERIVHRDVKPANVLHAGEGRWKLADFGIARMPDSDLTQVGIFMGTPGYAPPEAISQGHYTSQADVFAWGAVLYELLSGRIPYEGPDTRTTNGYVLKHTAKTPRDHDKTIPEPLSEICMTALHPSTDVRYKSGSAAEEALREAWELCLNSNMVSAAAFTSHEVAHDKVPSAGMHATISPEARPKSALVIESGRDDSSDDDPTRVMARPPDADDLTVEEANPYGDTVADPEPRVGLDSMAKATLDRASDEERAIEAKAKGARPDPSKSGVELLEADSPTIGLWIVVVFAVLVAGSLAAYYLISM